MINDVCGLNLTFSCPIFWEKFKKTVFVKIHKKSHKSKVEGRTFFFLLIKLSQENSEWLIKLWSTDPNFINFDGNVFFEKTAIFISDPLLIKHLKALGWSISTFLPKLIFIEKNQKKTFLNNLKLHKNRYLFFWTIFETGLYFSYLKKGFF